MVREVDPENTQRSRTALVGLSALGIGYVVAGLALFYGLAIDSMQVFNAALVAILLLLAVSMVIILRNEPLISRENVMISVFVFAAMALHFGLTAFTDLSLGVRVGALVFLGVVAPVLFLQYWPALDE